MTYATLLAHLELGRSNAGLLKVVGDLAARFDAAVIGAVACQPVQMLYGDGFLAGEVIEQDRAEIARDIQAAEAEFQSALHGRANGLEWRSLVTYSPLADYFVREARCADLIVTGLGPPPAVFDTARHVNVADVIMQAGRPVLIAPEAATGLAVASALIGWKDTRETRRAVVDALPLLKGAGSVTLVEIAPKAELEAVRLRLAEVALWFRRHGVAAEVRAEASHGEDAARLEAIGAELKADLFVAGAYGHTRLREWALGGVTQDLLLRAGRCSLLSH